MIPRPWELSGSGCSPSKLRSDSTSLGHALERMQLINVWCRRWYNLIYMSYEGFLVRVRGTPESSRASTSFKGITHVVQPHFLLFIMLRKQGSSPEASPVVRYATSANTHFIGPSLYWRIFQDRHMLSLKGIHDEQGCIVWPSHHATISHN